LKLNEPRLNLNIVIGETIDSHEEVHPIGSEAYSIEKLQLSDADTSRFVVV